MIRGELPISQVIYKAMVNSVAVTIKDHRHDIAFVIYQLSFKRRFKQGPGSFMSLVDGLGVGIEKMA
jgi:hypothetical protein